MKPNNQPQDRQQILIDLYLQYLKQEITTGELLKYLRKKSIRYVPGTICQFCWYQSKNLIRHRA